MAGAAGGSFTAVQAAALTASGPPGCPDARGDGRWEYRPKVSVFPGSCSDIREKESTEVSLTNKVLQSLHRPGQKPRMPG
ncbi:uncharacterized protein LOC114036962 isoform X2 [Vombatus ursinus]|uniref:uncharacterized protein LOC114036962 isoform X2 n=1 Tax=Vombatus ursinus TaxID=29139 RepID=UPI000FFDA2C7|nr:uncharacterized protein LOC114036962 isoform X2 [Vombatus ursinus]